MSVERSRAAEAFRQLQDMYIKAFVQADANFQTAEKNTTEDGGVKYSFGVTQADIDAYVEAAYVKENTSDYKKYAEVAPRLQEDVAGEIDISGYSHALRDNDIRHIRNSHGEASQEKYPVTKEDIKNIPWIVENYDKVYVVRKNNNRTGVMYVKVNKEGIVYYLEQVTTVYGNEPLLVNKQMVKTGIDDILNLPELRDAITKKQSETEFLNDLKKAQQVYAQSVNQFHSDIKIAQPDKDVNTESVEAMDVEADADTRYSDRDYSYEALTSKPDMAITMVGGNIPKNRADIVAQAKQNAAEVGKFDPKTGSVRVYVDDIGVDVVLGRDGLKHSLDRRLSVNAPVVLKAGEILKRSIRINETTPQKAEASQSYVLIGTAMNENGELYIVRSVINRFSNELASIDVLYAINAKKESAALLPLFTDKSALGTDSTITIAELLDLVNQYFPDVLPEDVLKHYGYDARPEGDLGEDVLYQDRDTESVSNRSLLANALEGAAKNDMEKNKIREYKSKIDLINSEEKKLRELNEKIKPTAYPFSRIATQLCKYADRYGLVA